MLDLLNKNLVDREVSSIVLVGGYVQLWFQPTDDKAELSLNIYTQITCQDEESVKLLETLKVGDLEGFLGDVISSVNEDEENLILSFVRNKKLCLKRTGDAHGIVGAINGTDF